MNNKLTFKYREKPYYTSVIIPVYKDSIGLKDTLDSLEKQTVLKNEFEIIVINDGGDKRIRALCADYNVQHIEIVPNRGSYYARNRGIEHSKGEYVAFVDANVIVSSNWIKNAKEILQHSYFVGGPIFINKKKISSIANKFDFYTAFPVEIYFKYGHFIPTANLIVKRYLLNELGGFDEELRSGGDKEFGNRVYNKYASQMQYSDKITVVHPPRGYSEIIKKMKRVAKGHHTLAKKYPKIFADNIISTKNLIFRVLLPPLMPVHSTNPFIKIFCYLFGWWLQIQFATAELLKRNNKS